MQRRIKREREREYDKIRTAKIHNYSNVENYFLPFFKRKHT